MGNVVQYIDLRATGASTATIRGAVNCCLLKLSRGLYSYVRRCTVPAHQRFAVFGEDEKWLVYHEGGHFREKSQRRRYQEHLKRLVILHYPHYRADDIVSGVSAARLHKLGMFGEPDHPVTVANARAGSRTGEIIRFKRQLPDEDVIDFNGLRVTNPARTALDLLAALGPAGGFAAMEEVLRGSMFAPDPDAYALSGYPPAASTRVRSAVDELFVPMIERMHRGVRAAQIMIPFIGPFSESYAESRASFLLHLLGLHDFVQQVDVIDGGRVLTRLDFLHVGTNVALYVDGTQKYVDGGFDRMNKESRQHNRLLSLGYKVIRFKFSEVMDIGTFARKLFAQAPELRGYCAEKIRFQ